MATKLGVQTQPSATYESEELLAQQPVILVQNADGSTDTSSTAEIQLALDMATSRFVADVEPLFTTHTVQPGSTASALILSPALSFPTLLGSSYAGRGYILRAKTVAGGAMGTYGISATIASNTGTTQVNTATPMTNVLADGSTSYTVQAGDVVEVHSGCVFASVFARAVSGVATFSGVRIMGYLTSTPTASSTGLTSVALNAIANAHAGNYDGVAELPRTTVTTDMPTINGVTVYVGPGVGDDYPATATGLQNAINARAAVVSNQNDAIILRNGVNLSGNWTLKKKAGGTGKIVIRGETTHTPEHTRTAMSTYVGGGYAKVRAAGVDYAFQCEPGASHYRLALFEVTVSQASLYCGGLLNLSDTVAENAGTGLLADQPNDVIADRMYIHGDPVIECKFGVRLGGVSQGVVDCYIADIHSGNQVGDSQAVGGTTGAGPFRIHNNYLEASSENSLFGGASVYVPGLVPSDITFTKNLLRKPFSWHSNATINGSVKNLWELKNARRVLCEGNVMEGCWQGGQAGDAVLLTPINQYGPTWNAGVRDVTFRYNVLRNASSGYNITNDNTENGFRSFGLWRFSMHDNAAWNINDPAWVPANFRIVRLANGTDVRLTHNTLLGSANTTNTVGLLLGVTTGLFARVKYDDNLSTAQSYAVIADGGAPGNGSITPTLVNGGGSFNNNGLVNFDFNTGGYFSDYPGTTKFPADLTAAGVATPAITSTWDTADPDTVLAALTLSGPLSTAASDGTQLGANLTTLRSAIAGVWSGAGSGAGPAHHLALTQEPSQAPVSGQPHATAPAGAVKDASNVTVTSDASTVAATLVIENGSATPIGTLTTPVISGLWSFAGTGLGATGAGARCHWHFADGSLTGVDSQSFTVADAGALVPFRSHRRTIL
jgi:hypothetical protein